MKITSAIAVGLFAACMIDNIVHRQRFAALASALGLVAAVAALLH